MPTLLPIDPVPEDVEVQGGASVIYVTFAENISPGDLLYKATDSRYGKTDNTSAEKSQIAGVAVTYGKTDGYGYVFTSGGSSIDLGVTLDSGQIYCVSDTPGRMQSYQGLDVGSNLTIVGFGQPDGMLKFEKNVTGLVTTA